MVVPFEFLDALAVGAVGLALSSTAKGYGQIVGSNVESTILAKFGSAPAEGKTKDDAEAMKHWGRACERGLELRLPE